MYDTLKSISNTVGLIGVALQLGVYFLLTIKRLSSNSLLYQLCNMIGACGILYSLMFHWNTPSVVVEIAWLMISVGAVVQLLRKQ
ncbi:MAG: hypothetical protein K0R24_1630 [Gammaproteobacteria bacterium]|jgi:hypothetical protein|nr:hypothetical protein [Gammaproteobacteria bacterium]MCE3238649.1 hypothetical protein [Gammaproteobacteria bacterium]